MGISAENRHLLVLDGHNSHVTLEVVILAMNSGLDIISLPSHTSHALQPLDVSCFKPFKTAFRQIRDSWTLLNKGEKVEKTDLCEWTSQALEKSLTAKNIKSSFKKTRIWPFNEHAILGSMQPSRGFEEGQDGYVLPLSDESEGEESGGGEECVRSDHELNEEPVAIGGINVSKHFYVDVPNPEESNYERGEQHIAIDPELLEEVQTSNNNNIAQFLSLPELILAKKNAKDSSLCWTSHRASS